MLHQKNYGICDIRKVSRYCYYAGLGAGFFGLACIVFLYICKIPITRVIPPCFFHEITGYYCPGCGGTRAILALLRGSLIECVCYHPFVLYAAICYTVYMGSHSLELFTRGKVNGINLKPVYFYLGAVLIVTQCLGKNYWSIWYKFLM